MREAAAEQRYERAAWLRRRRDRLAALLDRLGDAVAATHARPQLALATHERATGADAFWMVGGRIADWGPVAPTDDLVARTEAALARAGDGRTPHLTPDEIAETRIATTWLAGHDATLIDLADDRWSQRLPAFAAAAAA